MFICMMKNKSLKIRLFLVILIVETLLLSYSMSGKSAFTDIPIGAWYDEHVSILVNEDNPIINGYSDGTFRPSDNLTVDQFITMIVRANGFNLSNGKSYWAEPFITKAKEIGIIKEGTFTRYNRPITREEMSSMIIKSFEHMNPSQTVEVKSDVEALFLDGDMIQINYRTDVIKSYELGILGGYKDGTFRSSNFLSRAEAATILVRLLYPEKRLTKSDRTTQTITNYIVGGTKLMDSNGDGMPEGWSKPQYAKASVSAEVMALNFGVANETTRYLIESASVKTTGSGQFYLGMWIKTKAPNVRFYVVEKNSTGTTFPVVILDNQNGEWQYYSKLIDLSKDSTSFIHSLYIKDGKADGSIVSIKDVRLLNLTQIYGKGHELTKSQVDAILNPTEKGQGTQVTQAVTESVIKYGAIADANYYNPSNGNYYSDAAFKNLATDNLKFFQVAFDSGKNIVIPKGNYYVSNTVFINKGINVSAEGVVVYTKSAPKIKFLFKIIADNVKISGMTVKTTLDQKPLINGMAESGLGSNVYAFVVQSSNVTIDNVTTYNICRGIHTDKLNNTMKNLTITNSNFYDATIPVFIMYADGIIIDNSYLECNDSGLSAGLHSLYLGTKTFNATITNSNINFKSVNNGAVIQFFSSKYDEVSIKNIKIIDSTIETRGTHMVVLGEVQDVIFDNITFIKSNPASGRQSDPGKLIFAHEHVYDVTIQNSTLNMVDAASIINGKGLNYSNITLKNNDIITTLPTGTNLISTVMSMNLEGNTIRLLKNSSGVLFGFGGEGTMIFKDNTVISEATNIVLGSVHSASKGSVKLTNNIFDFSNKIVDVAFYNNASNIGIEAIGNKFNTFSKLSSNPNGTIDKNNLYDK